MKKLWWLLDAVWLIALAVYVLAGRDKVPFHGDESTLIAMSADYFTLVHQRDLDPILYDPTPADGIAQHLRLVNGPVAKMAMGLVEDLDGWTIHDLNSPWVWEWSFDQNVALGHMPNWYLLRAARTSSALLLIASIVFLFEIARAVGGSRIAAYAATLIYTTTPAVLMNGRRAMMEGAHLCFMLLLVWVAILLVRRPERRIAWTVALGVAAGLAVASKHTAAAVVAAMFVGIALLPGQDQKASPQSAQRKTREELERETGSPREKLRIFFTRCLWLVLAGIVFLALNPVWWSDPVHVPGEVLRQRRDLLDLQVQGYGGYQGAGERIEGLIKQAFYAEPQYYEVRVWQEYIGDQITTYETTIWAGRGGGLIWGGLLIVTSGAGLIVLIRRWRESAAWLALVWTGIIAVALVILTPLAWQRYYIPIQPPVAILAGTGIGWIVQRAITAAAGRRRAARSAR